MKHINETKRMEQIEKNIQLDGFDPINSSGWTMYPNAIQNDPTLDLGEKAVYAQFLQYAWHNDFCFPSQDRVAQNLGISRASVNKFVSGLARKGWLTIERRGQGKTNIYTLHATIKRKNRRSN